jgi:WD40 repeat protein
VALKVLLPGVLADPLRLARFRREAQAAARLHHTHIVPVLGVGECDGTHYLSLQLIDGHGLDAVLTELRGGHSLPPRDSTTDTTAVGAESAVPCRPVLGALGPREYGRAVARVGAEAAEALAHAHAQGLLHRDVKPANLLLDRQGAVWLTDFGLAWGEGLEDLTDTGDVVGTLRYLAPERLEGVADTAGDVYALGLVLYELLTLRPAFDATGRGELLHQVSRADPPRPRTLEPRIPADLETIVLKATAREPGSRYASAADLAADLRRFLADEPIRARPVPAWERGLRWARRRPAAVALLAMTVVAVLALAASGVWLGYSRQLEAALEARALALQTADEQRQLAQQRQTEAEQARADMREAFALNSVLLAHSEWRDRHLERARDLLAECPGSCHDWEWRYLHRLCHAPGAPFTQHATDVFDVAFSPDGDRLASCERNGKVRIWEAATGRVLTSWQADADVDQLFFLRDGRSLLALHHDGSIRFWDLKTGTERERLPGLASECRRLSLSGADRWLATYHRDAKVRLWDLAERKPVGELPQRFASLGSPVFSTDGTRFLLQTGYEVFEAQDWTGQPRVATAFKLAGPGWVILSPDGRLVAWHARNDKGMTVTDLQTGQPTWSSPGPVPDLRTVAFSPDRRWLAGADQEKGIRLWDLTGEHEPLLLQGHTRDVRALRFSPDSRRLASFGYDKMVRVWKVADQEKVRLAGHSAAAHCLAFSPDGQTLASGAGDKQVRLWDVTTGAARRSFGANGPVWSLSFGPDGRRLAYGDYGVRLVDLATGAAFPGQDQLGRPPHYVFGLAFSPDGRQLAFGVADSWMGQPTALRQALPWPQQLPSKKTGIPRATGLLGLIDVATNTVTKAQVSPLPNLCVAWRHDGQGLAVSQFSQAGTGQTVLLGPLLQQRLVQSTGPNRRLAFHPDGTRWAVVVGSTVQIWTEEGQKPLRVVTGHSSSVNDVTWSPDGRRLATASDDGTVKLWHPSTGRECLTLRGHAGAVHAVAFSPDGHWLASAGGDGQVFLWDARP